MSNQADASLQFDALIVGSGLAGLSLALKLADDRKVAVITKKSLLEGASAWAQGGIARCCRGRTPSPNTSRTP